MDAQSVPYLEICKELDRLGWPTDPHLFWCKHFTDVSLVDEWFLSGDPLPPALGNSHPAPNAQEIMEQLPPFSRVTKYLNAHDTQNKVFPPAEVTSPRYRYRADGGSDKSACWGDTVAEALARVWILLETHE